MIPDPNMWRTAKVTATRAETPRARSLTLAVDEWPGHVAGQHVDVRLTAEDGYQATRAYSIASAPRPGSFDLTVEELVDGEVSAYLVGAVEPGDLVEVRGPIGGAFTWRPSDGGPLLLVGGGSGVVPLMAIIRAHAAAGSDARVTLLLSARTLADVLYRAELESLASGGTIDFSPTLTREVPAGWAGLTGRIDAAMLAKIGSSPEAAPVVFICGPTGFVDHVADELLAQGHAAASIRTERFGPSGA